MRIFMISDAKKKKNHVSLKKKKNVFFFNIITIYDANYLVKNKLPRQIQAKRNKYMY